MVIVYAAMVISFLIDWGTFDSEIQKTIYLVAPLVTLWAGSRALKAMGWGLGRGSVVWLVQIGIFLWFIAEAILLWLDINNLEPYPSWADFFFLIGYPIFLAGVLIEWRIFGLQLHKLGWKLLSAMAIIALGVAASVGYLGLVVGYDPEQSLFLNFIGISWSLGDLVIGLALMLMFALVWEFREGQIKYSWLAFMLWGVFNLVADTLYGLFPDALFMSSYLSVSLDAMWVAGYFFIAYYFLETEYGVDHALQKMRLRKKSALE